MNELSAKHNRKQSNPIRIVTAASLFDGHDAAINIMRRILQASGAEVIHLGHDRSVHDVVTTAIQEDTHGIAITSYQGGHVEFFKYARDLLDEQGRQDIKIFGGGGGTILPDEQAELHEYGIDRIYSPDDGRAMGLQGMIDDLLAKTERTNGHSYRQDGTLIADKWTDKALGQAITAIEEGTFEGEIPQSATKVPILGITGTGGAGKSSLTDELVRRFLRDFDDKRLAIVSVDPSRRRSGGALLGDRIRMNSIYDERVYMRSMATRQSNRALSSHVPQVLQLLQAAEFDLIILESSGIGQSDTEIVDLVDVSLYVMTPEFGAASQLEKIDMLDFADVVAINKFDKRGAADALRDVKKQFRRNHLLWTASDDELPVYGTIASQFNDVGTTRLYVALIETLREKTGADLRSTIDQSLHESVKSQIIPPHRVRYLAEIAETSRQYDQWVDKQAKIANQLYGLEEAKAVVRNQPTVVSSLEAASEALKQQLDGQNEQILAGWAEKTPHGKSRTPPSGPD